MKYWIPFDAPLFGFHDSSWQKMPYGSQKYRTKGSHGCIHMPLAAITVPGALGRGGHDGPYQGLTVARHLRAEVERSDARLATRRGSCRSLGVRIDRSPTRVDLASARAPNEHRTRREPGTRVAADTVEQFVHLHVHTEYSMLDGAARLTELFAETARMGMPALAMTDHGNVFGAYDFYAQGHRRRREADHRHGGLPHPEHLPLRAHPGALGRAAATTTSPAAARSPT